MGLVQTLLGNRTNVQFILDGGAVISFDASVNEVHGRQSPPTEFEIEDGTTISDNIILKPFTLEIDGIISDTPLLSSQNAGALLTSAVKGGLTTAISAVAPATGVIAAAAGSSLISAIKGAQTPSQSAYDAILQLQENKEPFDVQTSLTTYEDMWIKDLKVTRDSTSGNILSIKVSLVELQIVAPQTTNLRIFANPNTGAPEANVGRQNLSGPFSTGIAAANKDAGVTQ